MTLLGKAFEDYVAVLLKERFSDYSLFIQHKLDSGLIPDFVLEYDEKKIVVDAKDKQCLTKSDVNQICEYMEEIDAEYGILYVAESTKVSETVEDFAIINAVEVEYTNWKSKSFTPEILLSRSIGSENL